jgi:antitoxin component YwqK of YwqJK toxin-antitoxin module
MENASSVNTGADIEIDIKNHVTQTMVGNYTYKEYFIAKSSKKIGNHSIYRPDNILEKFTSFKNGLLNGRSYTFGDNSNGNNIRLINTYKDEKYHGMLWIKYPNLPIIIRIYKNDKRIKEMKQRLVLY